jgi:hypothetical protein
MNIVPIILGVVLFGLLGYLAFSQVLSINKKISAISSSVVELQTQVKDIQKQVNNNVSFGTDQSLDALIHQIESEIDNETGQIQDTPNDIPTQSLPSVSDYNETEQINDNDLNHDELYADLENDLNNEFETINNEEGANMPVSITENPTNYDNTSVNIELVEDTEDENNEDNGDTEEPSMFDSEGEDDDEDDNEDDNEDNEDYEDDDEDNEDDEDDDEDNDEDDEDDDEDEGGDELTQKLHEHYLNKTQNELKNLCRKHNKSIGGNKETLVTRLLEVKSLRNINLS